MAERPEDIAPAEPDKESVELTEDDVSQFVAKLEDWGRQLSESEQLLLTLMIERAEGADPAMFLEPEGFGFKPRPREEFPPDIEEITNEVLKPLFRDRQIFYNPIAAGSIWEKAGDGGSWTRK